MIVTDLTKVSEAVELYRLLGDELGVQDKAEKRISELNELFKRIECAKESSQSRKVLYYIWKEPWMVVSRDTYISDALGYFGYENPVEFDRSKGEFGRYPELDLKESKLPEVDLHLFSSEPWPFRNRDIKTYMEHVGKVDCAKVDGKLFSWYGSTTVELLKKALLHHEQGLKIYESVNLS